MRRSKRLTMSLSSSPLKLPPINEDTSLLMDESLRGITVGPSSSSSPNKTLGDESLERLAWAEREREVHTAPLVPLSPNVEVRRRRTSRKSGVARPDNEGSSGSDQPRPKRSLPSLLEFSPKRRRKTRDGPTESPPTPEEKPSELLKLLGKTPSPKRPRQSRPLPATRGLHDVFSSSPLRTAFAFSPEESLEQQQCEEQEEQDDDGEEVTLRVGPREVVESARVDEQQSDAAENSGTRMMVKDEDEDHTVRVRRQTSTTSEQEVPAAKSTRVHTTDEKPTQPTRGGIARPAAVPPSKLVSPAKRKRGEGGTVTKADGAQKKASPFKVITAHKKDSDSAPRKASPSEAFAAGKTVSPFRTTSTAFGTTATTPRKAATALDADSPINVQPVNPVKDSILRKLQVTDRAAVVKKSPARQSPLSSPAKKKASPSRAVAQDNAVSKQQARSIKQPSAYRQVRSVSAASVTAKVSQSHSASPEESKRPKVNALPTATRSPMRSVSAQKAAASSTARGVVKASTSASPLRGAQSPLRTDRPRTKSALETQRSASSGKGAAVSVSPVGRSHEAKRAASPARSAAPVRRPVSPSKPRDAPEEPRRASGSAKSQRPCSPAKDCVNEPHRPPQPAAASPAKAGSKQTKSPPPASSKQKKSPWPSPSTNKLPESQTLAVAASHAVPTDPSLPAAAQTAPPPSVSPPKVRAAKKTPSPHKVKFSAAPTAKTTRSLTAAVARDAKVASQASKRQAKAAEAASTRSKAAAQVVPEGFRLTSTGSLAPVAPTLARGESVPFAPSALHQAKLQKAIEEEERIRKERSQVKAHQVPSYLRQRREELEKEREEELEREIAAIRQGATTSRKNALPDSLKGTRPRTRTVSTAASKPFVSSLEARNQERQAWEAKRKAKEELLEHERDKVREERRKQEEEELRVERQRTVVKAHPVPEHIYGKRRVVSRGEE